mmetsp:Transcript_37073/g.56958  ORF Transcript_37073/g.56958 Transcript_37073/m.56958 type:complete len:92 (-) Transcript_37073:156-431(-)|eukprot:CAMPEP_0118694738 /NCGR_PEP_ID=MMETSP0800-20121206/12736_1 /TAXON_ID=210618 ORGANISM="Striatella unipunctata, Strain CCMP2910" /NCGR_SAMPLE_ID=MMETSP0800 /ASSEMBLY_ACC=CAM_ASM_000638 /LENGTH=91 /DNA_ID=CAMNT_0006593329 /DNA_START=94 /DNA_END=369 /DNA_ORIENTATION=+
MLEKLLEIKEAYHEHKRKQAIVGVDNANEDWELKRRSIRIEERQVHIKEKRVLIEEKRVLIEEKKAEVELKKAVLMNLRTIVDMKVHLLAS